LHPAARWPAHDPDWIKSAAERERTSGNLAYRGVSAWIIRDGDRVKLERLSPEEGHDREHPVLRRQPPHSP
jgi:hypothetical protein